MTRDLTKHYPERAVGREVHPRNPRLSRPSRAAREETHHEFKRIQVDSMSNIYTFNAKDCKFSVHIYVYIYMYNSCYLCSP